MGIARTVGVLGCLLSLSLVAAATAQAPAKQEPTEQPIRVLYIEAQPRWDFRYITGILRHTPGVELSVYMPDAKWQPSVALPISRAEFACYDVILLGDVTLPGDAAKQDTWMKELMAFLDRGQGVAFLSGARMPSSYRGTLIEKLLPVELLPDGKGKPDAVEARLMPTQESAGHAVLSLEPQQDAATVFGMLPKLRYTPLVKAVKTGSQALLVDPDQKVGDQPAVVIAAGVWEKGRSMFIGTDETWRWRDGGVELQAAFWRNVVRFLAGRRR